MAEFDFSALSSAVVEAELPKVESGKKAIVDVNPFLDAVGQSYQDGKGRAVTVPNEHVKRTTYLIRKAAAELGIGVRVVTSLTPEEMEKAAKNKNVKVMFQGKAKKKYSPRRSAEQIANEATAENSPSE